MPSWGLLVVLEALCSALFWPPGAKPSQLVSWWDCICKPAQWASCIVCGQGAFAVASPWIRVYQAAQISLAHQLQSSPGGVLLPFMSPTNQFGVEEQRRRGQTKDLINTKNKQETGIPVRTFIENRNEPSVPPTHSNCNFRKLNND